MRLPLSWLNEYVKIDDVPVETLKDKLFSCGFEVEEIIKINENVKNIVVCQINAIDKHPNADKLSVCSVNAGSYGELQIVTNAKNIRVLQAEYFIRKKTAFRLLFFAFVY